MHIDISKPHNQCDDMYKMNYHMTICISLFKCKAIDWILSIQHNQQSLIEYWMQMFVKS